MLWIVVILIPLGFAIALPLTAVVRKLGRRMGALDSAGTVGHSKELRAVPNTGGIAIFLTIFTPLFAAAIALLVIPGETLAGWIPPIEPYLDRLTSPHDAAATDGAAVRELPTAVIALIMLGCIAALHVVGVIDDRRALGPALKLGVQLVAAIIMVWFCNVRLLEMLGLWPSVVVSVLWIVVITNAINFLDNMDGLAAGVSAIAAAFLCAATILNEQWFIAATLALLIGALLGFLVFNFPPASVFMGDGGSLVVGFLLAVLTARTTYLHESLGGGWYGVAMPVIVLAIPLYDLASVTLIRLREGRSPFVGDQRHFSHRLVERGLSKRAAVVMIWCFAAVTGIGGVSLGRLEAWQAMLVFAQTGLVLFTLVLLEHASRRRIETRDDG